MLRRIAVGLVAATALLALVAAAKPGTSSTGYELVTRTVSYVAPVPDLQNPMEINEVVTCPAGKRAVNGGLQSIANAPGTPSEFPSNYSRQYAGVQQNFDAYVSPPDLPLGPPSGPTVDGWRVTGRVAFSGWGDPSSGTRGVEWDRFDAVVTFYAICINP